MHKNTIDRAGSKRKFIPTNLDYYDMLKLNCAEYRTEKAARCAALQALAGNSSGSFRYEHRKTSVVLLGFVIQCGMHYRSIKTPACKDR